MQQDGSKYFACRPPIPPTLLTLWMGSISRTSTSSGHNHAVYQIKGNNEMQQHGSKYFACRPPHPTLWMGSIGQISTISEHGHVATQVKGNTECGKREANILPAVPQPRPWGSGQ